MASGVAGLSDRVMELVGVGLDPSELSHSPVGSVVWCEASPDATRLTVSYVARDDYPPTVLHEGGGWRGTVAAVAGGKGSEDEIREFVEAARRDGVEAYEADAAEPDSPRLARPRPVDGPVLLYRGPSLGMVRPDQEVPAVERAALELRAHEAWRRGELHGIVTEVFSVDPTTGLEPVDRRVTWPRLALPDVEVMMEETLAAASEPHAPSP